MSELGQLLLTILGAGLGALIAAEIAIRRFRNERAYDRRLHWYDDALQQTQRLRRITVKFRLPLNESEARHSASVVRPLLREPNGKRF